MTFSTLSVVVPRKEAATMAPMHRGALQGPLQRPCSLVPQPRRVLHARGSTRAASQPVVSSDPPSLDPEPQSIEVAPQAVAAPPPGEPGLLGGEGLRTEQQPQQEEHQPSTSGRNESWPDASTRQQRRSQYHGSSRVGQARGAGYRDGHRSEAPPYAVAMTNLHRWQYTLPLSTRPEFLKQYPAADAKNYNVNSFLGRKDPHGGKYLVPPATYRTFLQQYCDAVQGGYMLFCTENYHYQVCAARACAHACVHACMRGMRVAHAPQGCMQRGVRPGGAPPSRYPRAWAHGLSSQGGLCQRGSWPATTGWR